MNKQFSLTFKHIPPVYINKEYRGQIDDVNLTMGAVQFYLILISLQEKIMKWTEI